MKKSFLLLALFVVGCQEDSIDPLETIHPELDKSESISGKIVYNGETYYLSFEMDDDKKPIFFDLKSEESYNYISSQLGDRPTSSILISIPDSTTYLFDDNVQYKEFLDKLSRRKEEIAKNSVLLRTNKKRVDISTEISKKLNPSDSGMAENKFIYQQDISKEYSIDGLIGSFKKANISSGNSNSSGRMAWKPNIGNSYIYLFEDKNYQGSLYPVLINNGIYEYQEFYHYTHNVGWFDNKASSYIVRNSTTRTMQVSFWEHPNEGGHVIGIILPARKGATTYGASNADLYKIKLNPGCWIFCDKWEDKISSVSFSWYRNDDFNWAGNPISFTDVVNLNILTDYPYEYIWPNSTKTYVSLQKSSASNSWNAGAASAYPAGDTYGLEYQIESLDTDIMFGLSKVNTGGPAWNTIDYNVYISDYRGDVIQIWQRGNQIATYPYQYNIGDVITVVNHAGDGFVGFYHNDNFIYSLPTDGSSLYMDCAVYSGNSVIRKIHR